MSKKLIKIEASHPKLFRLYYDLGNLCNYKCWYCFPGANDGTQPWPDVDIVKKNIVHLINYYLNSGIVDDVELHLMGGEPTLWSKVGEFIQYVSANAKCKINVLTNGSRTLRWWEQYAEYFNHIGISVHNEYADIDHIIELGNLLFNKGISFHTAVIMDHLHWDKCVSIVDRLTSTDKQWVVLANAVHLDGDTSHFTKEQNEYLYNSIKRIPTESYLEKYMSTITRKQFIAQFDDGSSFTTMTDGYFMLNMMNRYKGWECSLGLNYLYIVRTGQVTGTCNQLLYGLPYYFNINDPEFISKFKPNIKTVMCEQNVCMCPGEAALSKRKLS